jgi:hypothetical protein
MSLGARRLKRSVLVLVLGVSASLSFISCGSSAKKGPPSGLTNRVLASQGVTSTFTFGGLVIVNGVNDTVPRVAPLSAGSSPGLMAISPTRNIAATFDASSNTVYAVDTARESAVGNMRLPGPTTSMIFPTAFGIAYAAVPTATVNGFSFIGAVDVLNFSSGALTTIGVSNAQTVVASSTGNQLLVFSTDSDSVTVLSPGVAAPPVDTSCFTNPPNAVCTIVTQPQGSRPVYAVVNGSTAYILNCGFECGGTTSGGAPATPSVAVLDLPSLTITNTVNVNGATYGLLNGSQLYVAGNGTPTGPLCASLASAAKTAATYCGTLDIVDVSTMTDPYFNSPSTEIAITDGYHTRMDMTPNGQVFIGSHDCTNIGNVGNPSGEVRGCLSIFRTADNSVLIPPDNGDVNGLQGFVTRSIEYVAEGGNLRVYDTTKDILLINDFVPQGSVGIVGYVGDVKAIDFF